MCLQCFFRVALAEWTSRVDCALGMLWSCHCLAGSTRNVTAPFSWVLDRMYLKDEKKKRTKANEFLYRPPHVLPYEGNPRRNLFF